MKALITGGGGQLASDLKELLGDDAVALSHASLDVADADALARAIEEAQPDVVINCAAFHNLDVCEAEKQFISTVRKRHPHSQKPAIIGN